jgi:lipocalin
MLGQSQRSRTNFVTSRSVQEEDEYQRLRVPSRDDGFDLAHAILNTAIPREDALPNKLEDV